MIKCSECGKIFNSQLFGKDYKRRTCKCKNLKISFIKVINAKFEYFTTVKYKTSPPEIVEIPDEKKEPEEEKTKKIGFTE